MLFVPSWWWHQVDTSAEPEQVEPDSGLELAGWSAAFNFWFEPLYVKGYACASCELQRNPAYSKDL